MEAKRWGGVALGVAALTMAAAVSGCSSSSKPAAECGPGLTAAVQKALDKVGQPAASDLRGIGARLRQEAASMAQPKQGTLTTFADDLDDMATFLSQPGGEQPTFKFFIDQDAADKACGAPLDTPQK